MTWRYSIKNIWLAGREEILKSLIFDCLFRTCFNSYIGIIFNLFNSCYDLCILDIFDILNFLTFSVEINWSIFPLIINNINLSKLLTYPQHHPFCWSYWPLVLLVIICHNLHVFNKYCTFVCNVEIQLGSNACVYVYVFSRCFIIENVKLLA